MTISYPELGSTKCLNPICQRYTFCRGLCWGCYQAALRLVAKNKTTWKALEGAGKCLKARGCGSRSETLDWLLSKPKHCDKKKKKPGRVTGKSSAANARTRSPTVEDFQIWKAG